MSDTDAFTLRPSRPAFVPRTTGRRQETTGTAGASNPQVRNQIRPSPQVANPAPRTRSRWRHGFEPRWDYQVRACIGESRLPVAPHWPRACTEPSPIRIPCRVASVLTASRPSSPFLQDGKEGQRAGFPAIFLVALSARRRVTMRCLHVVDGSGATAASARAASNV